MFVVTKFFINFKEAFPCYTASLSASKVQKILVKQQLDTVT